MSTNKNKDTYRKFSDILKTSWVKSSIKIGIIFLAIGSAIIFLLKIFSAGNSQLFLDSRAFVAKYGFAGIFFATILAGTVVPLGSPGLVVAAALLGVPLISLILVATLGFTLGMTINYALALGLGRPYVMRKMSAESLEEITVLWNKRGWIIYVIFGLIPILPVELLAFVCGLLKTRLEIFLTLSFLPRLVVFTILAYFGESLGIWVGLA
ncbi:DedA family protein [Candidatus Bathyarchaeota archaeon]|nr:DedA family protein [Candidatus Bathyarchaeota archaeon]